MLSPVDLSLEEPIRTITKKVIFSPSGDVKRNREEEEDTTTIDGVPESSSESKIEANESLEITPSPKPSNNSTSKEGGQRAQKRKDALSWDDYFMSIAFLSAMRSKDPSTQVGACIVNEDKRIVGIGYNGFPRGCSDDELPWDREGDNDLETKYPYVCHAEVNAILNKNSSDVRGCSMYVALFPCNECAKVIIQSGIREVIYMSDKYAEHTSMKASRKMMTLAKLNLRHYEPTLQCVNIDFSVINQSTKKQKTEA